MGASRQTLGRQMRLRERSLTSSKWEVSDLRARHQSPNTDSLQSLTKSIITIWEDALRDVKVTS